jgi:uncharacterized membrane protein YgdD (TMEM256/DUF423 family)
MHKRFLIIAAVLGALSVVSGAFGAHALKETLSEQSLSTYETAVRYQFYHVFALALTGILCRLYSSNRLKYAGIFFISGIILFSGSLYLLCFMPAFSWIGAITPLGGVCFVTGWLLLAAGISKFPSQ